jgi:pyrimidine oxygenase
VLRSLWETGRCDFHGEFFELKNAEIKPQPSSYIPLVCAGQSDRGIRFTAECGDRNFVIAGGNTNDVEADIDTLRGTTSRLQAQAKTVQRDVGTIGLFNVIASLKRKSMFMGLPTLVGGWETVAHYLDRMHTEAHLDACMFAFPDFEKDIDDFGAHIQPRMETRARAMN